MNTPRITVPGSKSITNRATLMAALANGTSTLTNVLHSDDTRVMKEALQDMGVHIEEKGTTLTIQGRPVFTAPTHPLDLGNAGTAVRFLTAILSHQPFTSFIQGDARMRERPIEDLVEALRQLGATIDCPTGCPPLTIHGHPLTEDKVYIVAEHSSQYLSALLILAPLLPNGLTLIPIGELTSKPYLDITLDLMNKFFIQTEREDYDQFHIASQSYRPTNLIIEADASSASYFFGAAAILGKSITIQHLRRDTLQPDIHLLTHLERMGCTVEENDDGITVTGPTRLQPLGTLDANDFPDGAMTLAVVSAFAKGATEIRGLHTLRIKESDRLSALSNELKKINAAVEELPEGLRILGNPDILKGAAVSTYNDHRMAMCFGMAQLKLPTITIENPRCVEKTYPTFWEDLALVNPHS